MIEELAKWIEGMLTALPYSRIGTYLRRLYWGWKLGIPERDITIHNGTQLFCTDNLKIGKGTSINCHVFIDPCEGFISIGTNVLIGPRCVLRAADHEFSDPDRPIRSQGHQAGEIIIEDDCWLGANVVVVKDVTIGRGSVIGAGAVVTRDIPPFSIAAGVPTRIIGHRGK